MYPWSNAIILFDSKSWCCSLPTNLDWWLVHHTEITATHRCDSPMATRFVGEVLFGNFSRTKDMMSIEDAWKKDRIFQVFNKTMDIYLSLFSSIISWSSWSLNYNEKPKDTTTDSLLPPGSWLCSSMASRGQSWTDANCRIWRQAAGAFCARGVGWEWGGSGTHVPPRNFRGEKCPCLDVPGS